MFFHKFCSFRFFCLKYLKKIHIFYFDFKYNKLKTSGKGCFSEATVSIRWKVSASKSRAMRKFDFFSHSVFCSKTHFRQDITIFPLCESEQEHVSCIRERLQWICRSQENSHLQQLKFPAPERTPSKIAVPVRVSILTYNILLEHSEAWAPALIKPSPADSRQDNKGPRSRNRNKDLAQAWKVAVVADEVTTSH